jgi:hypothetical protein
MKTTYLKSFFITTMIAPILSFAITNQNIENTIGNFTLGVGQSAHPFQLARGYPPVFYSSGAHCVASVSVFGDRLEIEDGSVWKISSYDARKAVNWRTQDAVLITQNHSWFSKYNYRIINQLTGSILEANLFLGPIKDGAYTRYIVSIDSVCSDIYLNDRTRWHVSNLDADRFYGWTTNDTVIIGYNSGWDSNSEGLLINVNKNRHIRAEQF